MKNKTSRTLAKYVGLYFLPILAAGVLFLSPAAKAAPLNLDLLDTPDILSTFIQVDYDSSTDLFTAAGVSLTLNGVNLDSAGPFSITAYIDEVGNASSGSLSIAGKIGANQSGILLTGTLSEFGFPDIPGSQIFEFIFDVTGGDLAGEYGSLAGVILHNTNFGGSFATSFSNSFNGYSDTAPPVPEPATLTLMLLGGGGLIAARRRRRVKRIS